MKKLLAFLAAVLLLAGCAADREQPAGTDAEASLAQSAMTKERWTDTDGTALDYWLYTPKNPAEDMPLIVYLHGGSGKGNDLEKILDEGSLPGYLWSGQLSPAAYVLIPQLPESCKGWTDRAEALMKLISHVEADCAIDSGRVSLTGHSMGGTGAWAVSLAYPKTFSAVAPLSGSVQVTEQNLRKLENLPVWAVVGEADTIVPPDSSRKMIEQLSERNPEAKITELPGTDHFGVPELYLDSETGLLDWLIAQKRG